MYRKIIVKIAPFHNVYGPEGGGGGAWQNDREKALAAMHRKAIVAKHANAPGPEQVLNIGSEISVEIQQLVEIALRCAGAERVVSWYKFDSSQPVGTGSRNSNND